MDDTITLTAALDRWYVSLTASDSIGSPRTIPSYRYGTDKLVHSVGSERLLSDITTEDIEALLGALKAGGMATSSRAVVYRPIRTFFRWCVARKLLDVSPVEQVAAPKAKEQPVEFVSDAEWAALIATTDSGRSRKAKPRDLRDRALLLFMASTGARVSEVAAMRLGDIRLIDGKRRILVHGKGGRDRFLPVVGEAAEAMDTYLARGRKGYALSTLSDALWLAPRGALSANGIAQLLAERGYAAGVTRRVHPHELRHRFVARALDKGLPIPFITSLTGHTTPAMVNRVYGTHQRAEKAAEALERAFA